MTPNDRRPTPGELAAYADGELGPAARRAVAAWLADHPDAAGELEAQQRLVRLWHESAAAEPGEAAWAGVLARVEIGLAGRAGGPAPQKWHGARFLWLLAGMATAAAVLLVVLSLSRPDRSSEEASADPNGEAFVVLADDEVEIMSIQADDTAALVVGQPPVREPVVLAAAEDISLHNIEPDADGMVADMYQGEPSGPSMIVAPLGTKD